MSLEKTDFKLRLSSHPRPESLNLQADLSGLTGPQTRFCYVPPLTVQAVEPFEMRNRSSITVLVDLLTQRSDDYAPAQF